MACLQIQMEQYRKSPRARFLDYESGEYFITICTKKWKHYLGEINDKEMKLSEIGKYVDKQLSDSTNLCKYATILLYVVMPNHIHFVVLIPENNIRGSVEERTPTCQRHVPTTPSNQRRIPTLSKYVASLKGAVTKYAKSIGVEFEWQSRFHDHLIRGSRDRNNISNYILNNVTKWQQDCFYNSDK